MDNVQLSDEIRNNLPAQCMEQFLGCLTVYELANVNIPYIHKQLFMIVNILPASKVKYIGHWVFLYIEDQVIYFFDSFALHPSNYSIYFTNLLRKHNYFKLWLMKH